MLKGQKSSIPISGVGVFYALICKLTYNYTSTYILNVHKIY